MRVFWDAIRMGMPVHQGRHRRRLFGTVGDTVLMLPGRYVGFLFMRVMEEPMGYQPWQAGHRVSRRQQEDREVRPTPHGPRLWRSRLLRVNLKPTNRCNRTQRGSSTRFPKD